MREKKIQQRILSGFITHSPLLSMLKLTFDLWYLVLFKSAISNSYEIKENNSRYRVLVITGSIEKQREVCDNQVLDSEVVLLLRYTGLRF